MSRIEIRNLKDLSEKEKSHILDRESLDTASVIEKTVIPLAQQMKADPVKALRDATEKYDGFIPDKPVLEKNDLEKAYRQVKENTPDLLNAFAEAHENLKTFHAEQKPQNFDRDISHNRLGFRFQPFDSAALYVPGGKALYPTTVLMGLTPATIAGVKEVTLLSPPKPETRAVPDIVAAMAYMAGASRILQAGGAQAVLAAAFGVPEYNISPADFIYGPGNIYVAAAKNYLVSANIAGIDSFAGPSEVIIIADSSANPRYLAHDLLAQAEHDENAVAILLCTDRSLAEKVLPEIDKAISERGERAAITEESIRRNGHILITGTLDEAVEFSNLFGPEHLEIQTAEDDHVLENITAAGSIFVGEYAPVAIGDYYSGTNHILPTGGAARYGSGVSVHSFFRRITWQKVSREGLRKSLEPITLMSEEEGLYAEHGYSVVTRFEDD